MEELTSTVKQNTDDAKQANMLAQTASDAITAGGYVVERVVTETRDISTNSSKVGEVINLIEGIAFQTNILALSAAVVAARAGSGFVAVRISTKPDIALSASSSCDRTRPNSQPDKAV